MNNHKALIKSRKIPKEDKYFNQEWLKKLYNSIDDSRDRAYIMYHAETGLRVKEVVNTELIHIDWDSGRTRTYDFKKDVWRFVYWPESVKPALKMWLKRRQAKNIKSKLLFPFTEKTANRIIKKWSKQIGFPFETSSHFLRHTFIRLSRQAGRDIVAVRQNTGDTYKTILEWYSGLNNEDMQREFKNRPLTNI